MTGGTHEFGHERNHQVEQTNGLDERKAENGVREELAAEGGVAGDAVEERGEDEADTDTRAGQTNGRRAHTKVARHLHHGLGDLGRVGPLAGNLSGELTRASVQGRGLLAPESSLELRAEA